MFTLLYFTPRIFRVTIYDTTTVPLVRVRDLAIYTVTRI